MEQGNLAYRAPLDFFGVLIMAKSFRSDKHGICNRSRGPRKGGDRSALDTMTRCILVAAFMSSVFQKRTGGHICLHISGSHHEV